MPWQLFVSFRYLTAKRKEKFISIISLISVLGIAVGVASLIVVISVMAGFDRDLQERIVGVHSHLTIESDYGVTPSQELMQKVLGMPHVVSASYYLNGQALIRRGENVTGVVVRGINVRGESTVSKLATYLKEGALNVDDNGILLGSELAGKMRVKIGDTVTLVSPAYTDGKEYIVKGIFTSGMYEYDMNLAYINIPQAQELFVVKGLVSGVSVKVDDGMRVAEVKRSLLQEARIPYAVRTWMDQNRNLMEALKLEKTVMFIILTLIVMVACFNIASTLIMTVMEKTKDIGILKALGATRSSVMTIFALQGGVIGFLGTAFGTAIGLGLCGILEKYKFIELPRDIYYIDRLPVSVNFHDIGLIVMCSICISFAATIYPSYQASRLDPVEALRYE